MLAGCTDLRKSCNLADGAECTGAHRRFSAPSAWAAGACNDAIRLSAGGHLLAWAFQLQNTQAQSAWQKKFMRCLQQSVDIASYLRRAAAKSSGADSGADGDAALASLQPALASIATFRRHGMQTISDSEVRHLSPDARVSCKVDAANAYRCMARRSRTSTGK